VAASEAHRIGTGVGELDRVLGGGVVAGSVALVAGEPGIGKSTLLLQAAAATASAGHPVLYVSGEESPAQIRLRAERVGALRPSLSLLPETCLEGILAHLARSRPRLLVLDSVQTTATEALESAPGTIAQVREVALQVARAVRAVEASALLVGHVTKDGSIAGPKALEHLVDVVLVFEGERDLALRILRASKNRFGSTEEIGVFEMTEGGLREVANPSAAFLAERPLAAAGSAVAATLEGQRPFLVEVQALVAPAAGPVPRRVLRGVDAQRATLLLAVLEKRLGVGLAACDVFANVPGGVQVREPALDLALAAASLSSFRGVPVDPLTVFFGEVGLVGEVRTVRQAERRLGEAARLGLQRAVVPAAAAAGHDASSGLALRGVRHVGELAEGLFPA
jgi:DNA repair protein RadA/Sms